MHLKLESFIRKYEFLSSFFAIDFLVSNWTLSLPLDWQQFILESSMEDEELARMASGWVSEEWPSTLQEYIQQSRSIGLDRAPNDESYQTILKDITIGMNVKKVQETRRLGGEIDRIAKELGATHILDLGCGQGYLSTVLSYQYGYTVVGMDGDPHQTSGAEQRAQRIERMLKFRFPIMNLGALSFITSKITNAHNLYDLLDLVFQTFPEMKSGKWLLCGLHCCGDLSPTMIRAFLNYKPDNVLCLVSLGCCYHSLTERPCSDLRGKIDPFGLDLSLYGLDLLSEKEERIKSQDIDDSTIYGYPMSQKCKDFPLGFQNRVAACQALDRWGTDKTDLSDSFRRLFYRSVLQRLLRDNGIIPQSDALATRGKGERAIKKLGVRDCENPIKYTRAALKRLGCDHDERASSLTDEAITAAFAYYGHARKEIATIWTLRCLLSDVLESFILLDRMEAIEEAGFNVGLFVIAHMKDSPRNMALVLTRPQK